MKNFQKLSYMALGAVFMLALVITIPVFDSGTQRQLTAHFNNIRVVVEGVLITPRDGLGNIVEPFVVDGTTYLPVRAVAEALGKAVEWDGSTQTVYIGARPGSVQFLTDVVPAHQTGGVGGIGAQYREYSALRSGGAENFNLGGVRYANGMVFGSNLTWAVYNLNGQYTSLSGIVSHLDGAHPPADWMETCVRFFTDGQMVLEVPISGQMSPHEFTINLTGVNQLRIETSSTGLGLCPL
jgi:hypothetical protein